MTLGDVRNLIRGVSNDIASYDFVSDLEIDSFIRKAAFEIARLLNDAGNDYYKKQNLFNVAQGTMVAPITPINQPISELVHKLIYAYIVLPTGAKLPCSITSMEGVAQAEFSGSPTACIGYSKTSLFIHPPLNQQNFTLFVCYYSNPNYPISNTDDVDVPACYTNFLIALVKKMMYLRHNWVVPKWVEQDIYIERCKI